MCPLGRKIFSTLAPRSRPEHEHRGAAAWSWCSSVVSYGTSGRHWDLTEAFLTPLRLQGFRASASAARLDTRPSARGERVLDSPRGATPRFGPRHRDEITSPTRHDEVTLSPQRY